MLALGCKAWVERRWDQHFDDRLFRPAVDRRVEIGAVHVIEARRHDDARGQVIALLGQDSEFGQLRQCDVHAESRAFALPAVHPACDVIVHPAARPFETISSSTGVLSRMSTPASRAARAIACVIEPIPPIAWPHAPGTPAASPKRWWSST